MGPINARRADYDLSDRIHRGKQVNDHLACEETGGTLGSVDPSTSLTYLTLCSSDAERSRLWCKT